MDTQPARAAAYNALATTSLNRYEVNTLLNNHAHEAITPLVQIVTDYVIESNDVGGLDCNDLADRIRSAGYLLIGDDDPDPADDEPVTPRPA